MQPIRSAEILCVGTELLLGQIVNTNAAWLARELSDLGVTSYY
ncbi:MAG: molybdopterin-binding protein, partial [Eubacteriales bacterium]|nr:molybdopterin-binding protein [Eubacteriales bacterium]